MSQVILIAGEPFVAQRLRRAGFALLEAQTTQDGVAHLEAAPDQVAAVVLGAGLPEPVRTAQRVHARRPDTALVILCEGDAARLSPALRCAPFIGTCVSCVELSPEPIAGQPIDPLIDPVITALRETIARSGSLRAAPPAPPSEDLQASYFLGQFFDRAPMGIVVLDHGGHIVTLNRGTAAFFQRSERDLLGIPLPDLFQPQQRSPLDALLVSWPWPGTELAALSTLAWAPQPPPVLCECHPEGGTGRIAEVAVSPLYIGAGRLGFLALIHDVTDRVKAERERAASATEALRLRDDFLALAAHELRTPLTPLQLILQGLNRALSRPQQTPVEPALIKNLSARVRLAVHHGERLARLIDTLLDMSELSAGKLDLVPEPLDLAALARSVCADLADEAEHAGSTLSVQGDAAFGSWDRRRLGQVVANLVSNAIKYGGGRPIEIVIAQQDRRAHLLVRDGGIGIDPGDQQRIFGRFERAASLRHYGGLGLGLWLVRRLVEAHGGSIGVRSAPGQGSTFLVSLPLPPALAPARAPPPNLPP